MKPKLLDLFCCAGGASMGYHRAGFNVTGVDIAPQPHYPFGFVQADALAYVAEHGHEYDAIHASPPCQRYSKLTPSQYRNNHPDLIASTRTALRATGKPYIIENVENARHLLIKPIMLCGSMFGLNLWRHRYFELWPSFVQPTFGRPIKCMHGDEPILLSGVFRRKGKHRREHSAQEKREASGLDWMTIAEMDEAIPPAFTEYIGRHLIGMVTRQIAV